MLGLLPKPMPPSAARVEPVDSLSLSLTHSLSLFRHLRHAPRPAWRSLLREEQGGQTEGAAAATG